MAEEERGKIELRPARPVGEPPSAPAGVRAFPGEQSATVIWTGAHDGAHRYEVTAMPGGETVAAEAGQTSALVPGLQDHRRYTFTVTAISPVGRAVSMPSAPVWPGDDVPAYLFPLQLLYLLLLLALAFAYALAGSPGTHGVAPLAELIRLRGVLPAAVAGVPLSIPWFGALGAVMISLTGIFAHGHRDWRRGFDAWHIARPLLGAAMAMIGFLILSGIFRAAGSGLSFSSLGSGKLVLYAIAFVIGFREAVFRDLVKQVADIIISPGLGRI